MVPGVLLNQKNIESQLRSLGVHEGSCIEVHSSLGRIGQVEGGATTVVEALINVVGSQGAVVMSAYLVSPPLPVTDEERGLGIAWKVRLLPEGSSERTGMGVISDTFRDREDVVLGTGLHRVCAWGKDAEKHSKGYQHLVDIGGLVVLIGVDIDRCSSLHLADGIKMTSEALTRMNEQWIARESVTISEEVRRQYPSEIIIGEREGWINGHPWNEARDEADRRGLIKKGKIGAADGILFKALNVLCLLEEVYCHGPFPRVSA